MLSRSFFALALLVSVGFAAPARAQIYSWHDQTGHLVLSDRACSTGDAPLATYGVPHASSVRTTARAAADPETAAFDDLIAAHARENGVRTDLVRAVIQVESGFNPSARSPKGAMGLMQLMPATVQQFGVANPYNPGENIKAGVAYLRQLLDRYDEDEALALAAYNAGPGAVDRHGASIPPYRETQQYVSKVSELAGASQAEAAATRIYRSVQIVNGNEVVRFSNTPDAGATPAVRSPADPDGRTPAPAPRSSSVFPTR